MHTISFIFYVLRWTINFCPAQVQLQTRPKVDPKKRATDDDDQTAETKIIIYLTPGNGQWKRRDNSEKFRRLRKNRKKIGGHRERERELFLCSRRKTIKMWFYKQKTPSNIISETDINIKCDYWRVSWWIWWRRRDIYASSLYIRLLSLCRWWGSSRSKGFKLVKLAARSLTLLIPCRQ